MSPDPGTPGRARRLALALTLALGLGWAGAATELRANVSPPEGTRSTYSVSFSARNTGDQAVTLTPALALPPGWRLLLPPEALTLAPGGEGGGALIVVPPPGVGAGTYPARLTLGEAAQALDLGVAARPELRAETASVPAYTVGEPYEATFLVTNTGNVAQTLTFAATGNLGFDLAVVPGEATLPVGGTAQVRVRAVPPAQGEGVREHVVFLTARGDTSATAAARTEVLPARLPLSATFVTLPLVLTAEGGVGGEEGFGLSVAGGTVLPGGDTLDVSAGRGAFGVAYRRGRTTLSLGRRVGSQAGRVPDSGLLGARLEYETPGWAVEGGLYLGTLGGASPLAQFLAGGFGAGAGFWARPVPGVEVAGHVLRVDGAGTWSARAALSSPGADGGAAPGARLHGTLEAAGNFGPRLNLRASAGVDTAAQDALLSYERVQEGGGAAQHVSAAYAVLVRPAQFWFGATYGSTLADPQERLVLLASTAVSLRGGSLGAGVVYRPDPAPSGVAFEVRADATFSAPVVTSHSLTLRAEPGRDLRYQGRASLPTRPGCGSARAWGGPSPPRGIRRWSSVSSGRTSPRPPSPGRRVGA